MANSENEVEQGPGTNGAALLRLRLYLLVPLTLVFGITSVFFVLHLYDDEQQEIRDDAQNVQHFSQKLYQLSIEQNAIELKTLLKVLERDKALHSALERGDRAELLEDSAPLFSEMNKLSGITHMYFTRPDRVNLLRVHQPSRYGDVIDRFTTQEAARTGALASGLELGPLGTYTLRVVSPWYANEAPRRLIGFVELGLEIDRQLGAIREVLGVQPVVLLRKQFLQREGWESSMRAYGRAPDWDRYSDVVVGTQGAPAIPDVLMKRLKVAEPSLTPSIEVGRAAYRSIGLPLRDARGVDVGEMVILQDTSSTVNKARTTVAFKALLILLAASVLLGFLYWVDRRIQIHIKDLHRQIIVQRIGSDSRPS